MTVCVSSRHLSQSHTCQPAQWKLLKIPFKTSAILFLNLLSGEFFASKAQAMYDFPIQGKSNLIMTSSSQEKELKDAKFLTEIRAGLTTFFTMAYVIAVNVSLCITSLKD